MLKHTSYTMTCESRPGLWVKTGRVRHSSLGAAAAYSCSLVRAPRQCSLFCWGEAETSLAVSITLFHDLRAKRAFKD